MKKILFLLLITISGYSQTYQNPTFGTITSKTAPLNTTADFITTTSTEGIQGKILGENIPLSVIPPVHHFTPVTNSIKGYFQGVDDALGDVVATTAGITTRLWLTADQTTITAGTFYKTNFVNKGIVASAIQSVSNNDNEKKYFTQDIIGDAYVIITTFPKGVYAGNLSVSTSPNSAQQRFTVEVYKCDTNGTPIASGISGAVTGDLGVTVITILDSGLLTLADGSVTNVPVSASIEFPFTINVGERVRYHISAEKVGTTGASITESLYLGTSYNSYIDVPVPLNTSAVQNLSEVAGATTTDALNNLNAGAVYKKTIAQIRSLSGTLPTNNFYTTDIRQEGEWYYDASDVVSADNTGTVLVTSDGKRIKRIYENKTVNIEWFGAIGDGYTDNTSFIQSAINTGKKIFVPEGIYIASNITLLNNSSLSGLGEKSILKFKTGSTGYMLNGDLVGGISLEKISLYGADDIEYQTVSSIGTRAGIYLNTNAPKSKITNCKIYGFSAIGVGYNGTVTSKDNKSIDISNCNFLSNYCAVSTAPSGVNHYTAVSGGTGGEYSNIIGSSFYLNRYAVVASAGNTNITGNVISNNGYGIYTTSVSNVGHGNIVSNLINHSTVNSIEMVDNIIGHVISGNSIYSGNIVFTNCTGIIFSSNQISVTGITISGTGFHNFADNFYFLDPVISGGLTNCLFSNNFSKTTNEFVANDSFVGKITSGYIPKSNSVGRFVNANIYDDGSNIGVGTINPIGKLTIATGTDPTTSISAQVSGTVSMSNNGTGVSLPVISSKSNSSIGMYLIGATADIHAGSTDFQLNVRETDNTDFATLTSSAFKFSRFSTTLVDILRNGNTSFTGNISAPLFTGGATLTGTPTAPTATAGTNTTQVATCAFVLANTRPYASYVAVLTQTGTSAPVATVLENTLGGTPVWSYVSIGIYDATLTGAFNNAKTAVFFNKGEVTGTVSGKSGAFVNTSNTVRIMTVSNGTSADAEVNKATIEIRVYP